MHQSQYGSHIMGLSVLNRASRVVLAGYEGCADCCLCQPTAREGGAISHARHEINRTFFFLPYQSSIIFLHALLKCPLLGAGQDTAAALAKKPGLKQTDKFAISFLFHTHI